LTAKTRAGKKTRPDYSQVYLILVSSANASLGRDPVGNHQAEEEQWG